jgi:hypothetical protein
MTDKDQERRGETANGGAEGLSAGLQRLATVNVRELDADQTS